MTKEMLESLEILAAKEDMLSRIVVWLKAKKLWEECKRDIDLK